MKKKRIKDLFLEELRKIAIVGLACNKLNVSRNTIYTWRKTDQAFADEMDAALFEGDQNTNDSIEARLIELAVKDKEFQAIKYHLEHRNPKYKKKDSDDNGIDEYIKKVFKQMNSIWKHKEIDLSEHMIERIKEAALKELGEDEEKKKQGLI